MQSLNGHLAEVAHLCYDCGEPLDPNGGACTRLEELTQTKAFAAAICAACKAKVAHCELVDDPDYYCGLKPKHKGKCVLEEKYA